MTEIHYPGSFLDRFPSRHEVLLVFAACIFPIHAWTTIVFLYNFPSLILKANLWQILGVFAYALIFALLESLLLLGVFVLLAVILPTKVFRERFVYLGTILALVIPGLALLANTQFMQDAPWAWLPLLGVTGTGLIASFRRQVDDSRQAALANRFTLIGGLFFCLDMAAMVYMAACLILL
jgi:hypothetical protein